MINPRIRTFLKNTAQLCLKTVLKVVFLEMIFNYFLQILIRANL